MVLQMTLDKSQDLTQTGLKTDLGTSSLVKLAYKLAQSA